MQITRLPDWRPRLDAWIAAAQGQVFVYGVQDCALFAAGAVEAMTGIDLAAEWRGRYASEAEGRALVGGDHVALARSLLPARPSVLDATIGDVAIVEAPRGRQALAIVGGEHILGLHPVVGLTRAPLTDARAVLAV